MAKKIDFPEKEVLTAKEYNKLISHLRNSALWYATNSAINSGQLIQKFKDKGLPEGEHKVDHSGEIKSHDFYAEILSFLEENLLLNDRGYAERLIEREFGRGKSTMLVKQTLWMKKVDSELADELLEAYQESIYAERDLEDALTKIYDRVMRSSKYRKAVDSNESDYVLDNLIVKAMMSKGFNYGVVQDFLEEKKED